MNKKGFAVTGILYTLLLIAIVSLNLLLYNLLNRKTLLDQIKTDTVNAVEKDSDFEYLVEEINKIKATISIDKIYPIGSIYITASNVNPSTLFKDTTWERYGVGKTLVSTDSTSGEIGGSNTVTLAIANLPSHSHSINHTHTTKIAEISSSGSHTHSTKAQSITNGLTAQKSGSHYHGVAFAANSGNARGFTHWGDNYDYDRTSATRTLEGGVHTHNVTGTIPSLSIESSGAHTHNIPNLITETMSTTVSGNTGNSTPINIQNPYITVYIWKRIQ